MDCLIVDVCDDDILMVENIKFENLKDVICLFGSRNWVFVFLTFN